MTKSQLFQLFFLFSAAMTMAATLPEESVWRTEGFAAFRSGSFGNGGQNIYVSRSGALQRIQQTDLNKDGFFDLVFANSQNHNEAAPSYVYDAKGTKIAELPGMGSVAGSVADLNNDGFDDIVICGFYDLAMPFAASDIYFGSDQPYSENHHIQLPTPWAVSVAAGRFTGEKTSALAFVMPVYKKIRIFYPGELGFEWRSFTDLPIEANLAAACDLDMDGYDDLIVRGENLSATTVYWGGSDGINVDRHTLLPELPQDEIILPEAAGVLTSETEKKPDVPRLLQIVKWKNKNCFTLSTGKDLRFYFADRQRQIHEEKRVPAPMAIATAVGDADGDGQDDIIVGTQYRHQDDAKMQTGYFFWSGEEINPSIVPIDRVSDVAVLPGNKIIFCQSAKERSYTNDSVIFQITQARKISENSRLQGEDARRVYLLKNPGRDHEILLVNHCSRSSVGYDSAYVYWGDKTGYRPDKMQKVPGWCAVDSAVADLDDDGWAELVIFNDSDNSHHLDPGHFIHRFGSNGFEPDKTVRLQTDLGSGGAVADFNRDGFLDIISGSNGRKAVKFFFGGPDGFQKTELISLEKFGSVAWLHAVDLNLDGFLDIVLPLLNADHSLILWGGKDGYDIDRRSELAVLRGSFAQAADLNRDGYPELIIGGHVETPKQGDLTPHQPHNSFVYIYWNGPAGLSESRKTILRGNASNSISIADFNNDGYLDVFAGSYHDGRERDVNSFLYWNRQGRFSNLDRQILFTHSASGSIPGDFNNDGYIDLAVANHKVWGDHQGYSEIWWNGPKGFNSERTTHLPTSGPHGMFSLNPGNQLDRSDKEYYFSAPWSADMTGIVSEPVISGEIPPKTEVTIHLRVAATPDELRHAQWRTPQGIAVKKGDILQYRLTLQAENALQTPRITAVEIKIRRP